MKTNDSIKYFRNQANLTQQELADKAKLGLASIQRYEKGTRFPSVKALESIAEALGVSLNRLIEGSYEEDEFNENYNKVLEDQATNGGVIDSVIKMGETMDKILIERDRYKSALDSIREILNNIEDSEN